MAVSPLPRIALPTETVDVMGEPVTVRALTRAEALRVRELNEAGDLGAAELWILGCGTDTSEEEVADWYKSAPAGAADPIIDAVVRISALNEEEASKSGPSAVHDG